MTRQSYESGCTLETSKRINTSTGANSSSVMKWLLLFLRILAQELEELPRERAFGIRQQVCLLFQRPAVLQPQALFWRQGASSCPHTHTLNYAIHIHNCIPEYSYIITSCIQSTTKPYTIAKQSCLRKCIWMCRRSLGCRYWDFLLGIYQTGPRDLHLHTHKVFLMIHHHFIKLEMLSIRFRKTFRLLVQFRSQS